MGLFDTVKMHSNWLPMKEFNWNNGWQTKDLDCDMSHYEIDADGVLWKMNYGYHWKESGEDLSKLPVRQDTCDRINLYQFLDCDGGPHYWCDYWITFENGKIASIEGPIIEE